MRKIFIISYSGVNSTAIEQAIKSYGSWFHVSKETYLIGANTSAKDIRLKLDPIMLQGKDKLLILEVSIKDAQGWLQDNEWAWIKTERSRSN